MKMKEGATDVNYLRAKFRWEFLKRNKGFQDALKKEYKPNGSFESLEIIPHFEKEFGLPWSRWDVQDAKKAIQEGVDEEILLRRKGIYQSCISIIKADGDSIDGEQELDLSEHQDIKLLKEYEWIDRWAYKAINQQDYSIILRIRLHRGKESIMREIQYLLDLLEMEM